MGLFRNKNSSEAVQNAINEAIYPSVLGDTSSIIDNPMNNGDSGYMVEMEEGSYPSVVGGNMKSGTYKSLVDGDIVYYNDAVDWFFEVPATTFDTGIEGGKQGTGDLGGDMADWWDIAQSHFFTVQIYGANSLNEATGLHDLHGNPISFASGRGTYANYLPIKSMNFNYTSYDNMNIPMGIFGDLPLLYKKKVTSISFTCYDTDQDIVEKAVHYWEHQCFPGGNYVAYLDDIAATLRYTSFDVCGNMNFYRQLEVIPASSVSVSRSYEENGAKLVNFSVVAVGAQYSSGATGENNKVYYKGKTAEQINEWENRPSGREYINNPKSKYHENYYEGINESGNNLAVNNS